MKERFNRGYGYAKEGVMVRGWHLEPVWTGGRASSRCENIAM
jgi:hypothetical protein